MRYGAWSVMRMCGDEVGGAECIAAGAEAADAPVDAFVRDVG